MVQTLYKFTLGFKRSELKTVVRDQLGVKKYIGNGRRNTINRKANSLIEREWCILFRLFLEKKNVILNFLSFHNLHEFLEELLFFRREILCKTQFRGSAAFPLLAKCRSKIETGTCEIKFLEGNVATKLDDIFRIQIFGRIGSVGLN
jgi:hypothetical protein